MNGAEPWSNAIRRVELRADEAFGEARAARSLANSAADSNLALHESLGMLAREVAAVRMRVNSDLRGIEDKIKAMGDRVYRDVMDSTPEIVDREITAHGVRADARKWRWSKAMATKMLERLILSGLLLHWVAHLLRLISW